MTYDQFFQATLLPLPCPVSKEPAGGKHETYATFNEVLGTFTGYASNQPSRLHHTVQVHVFSKCDDGTHQIIFNKAIAMLRAAGVRVYSYGHALSQSTPGYHHIAATCEWVESLD